jgi:selenocysteine-specific elongation factor
MIIATAGHVDHGKTSLVQALTGVDTDRLAEEKRRGLTIEPGFAYLDLGGPRLAGFVDVPGHDRFVRNMVTGVSMIDLVLLVIAADDGPMPQTLEHLAIVDLLGATRAVVALTKIDRVTPEEQARASEAIGALLASTRFRGAPVFPVATPQRQGIAALREHLVQVQAHHERSAPAGNFRLAIDRSFSVAGAGLVVTGVVLSGRARVGDSVRVSPSGETVRIRSIHAHSQPADEALAGQRCALNIVGPDLDRDAIGRGRWLLAEPAHAPTDRLDATLNLLADEPRALTHFTPVQLHIGAAAVNARIAPLGQRSIDPGTGGPVQLLLEHPIAALAGDRFVIRDAAARRTMGGGLVLDPFAPARGRSRPARLSELSALTDGDIDQRLRRLLENAPQGVSLARFEQGCNLTPDEAAALRARLSVHTLASPDGLRGLAARWWAHWLALIPPLLAQAHAQHPDQVGPIEVVLVKQTCQTLVADLADATGSGGPSPRALQAVASAAIRALVGRGEVVRDGICLRLPAHRARLSAADQALLERITPILLAAGLRPPIVGELATALGLERSTLLEYLRRMGSFGHLVAVAPNRYFLPQTLPALADIARRLAQSADDGGFDAAGYRDASGIGRNLTIEVLEFLDRSGVTVFAGNRRRLRDA